MRIMSEIVDPEGWLASLPRRIDWSMNSYTHPKWLKVPPFDDNVEGSDVLNPVENVSSVLVDAVVDCMARFALGVSVEKAFSMPLRYFQANRGGSETSDLMNTIQGLDDRSIINAVKLFRFADYDDRFGIGHLPFSEGIEPDEATIQNVRMMVERSLRFFKPRGPEWWNGKMPEGFTLARESFVPVRIPAGDAMLPDTCWDLKASESCPTTYDVLRLIMYRFIGICSDRAWLFRDIPYLGVYNPRLNEAYRINVGDISEDMIAEVEGCVIYHALCRLRSYPM